ncbi:MAG: HD-GYP domain-containing protein, partial [Epulopiscium sp.]|nr:HD-GYP domain-containing protein [Candidatus Epulonipiscium sp.]
EIPFFSRIISVADVYDALTSHRPYRSPIQPISATEYIMGGCDTYFDSQIIDAFLHRIELYRIGSYVKLSNGAIGQVIGYEQQLRPILRLYPSEKIIDLYHDPKYLNIVIRGTCHPPRKRENKFNL